MSSFVEISFEFQEHSTLFLLLKWGTYKMQTPVVSGLNQVQLPQVASFEIFNEPLWSQNLSCISDQ